LLPAGVRTAMLPVAYLPTLEQRSGELFGVVQPGCGVPSGIRTQNRMCRLIPASPNSLIFRATHSHAVYPVLACLFTMAQQWHNEKTFLARYVLAGAAGLTRFPPRRAAPKPSRRPTVGGTPGRNRRAGRLAAPSERTTRHGRAARPTEHRHGANDPSGSGRRSAWIPGRRYE